MSDQVGDALWLTGSVLVVVGSSWLGWWLAGKAHDRFLRRTVNRQIEEFETRNGR